MVDRATRRGLAIGFGDSVLVVLRADGTRQRVLRPDLDYVRPGEADPLLDHRTLVEWPIASSDLVVLFSDGLVDAFGPGRGIDDARLAKLAASHGFDPLQFVRTAAELGLANAADGSTGGRDNLTIAATRI